MKFIPLLFLFLLLISCSKRESPMGVAAPKFCPNGIRKVECTNYPKQSESPYVLPFSIDSEYEVSQGNCTTRGHLKCQPEQFAYDFRMPIGTLVIASRGGTVVKTESSFPNGNMQQGGANYIYIDHGDGTQARYIHLTTNGVLVEIGQIVERGDSLGYSGNSGRSSFPHLHIEVAETNRFRDPVPIVFLNTRAHLNGLIEG